MQNLTICSVTFLLCFLASQEIVAQTETTPPNTCPRCEGSNGTWYVNYPWFSQYSCVKTKAIRSLCWGSMSSVIRNPENEGAKDVTRTVSEKVSFSYTVTDSGSSTATIKAELGIPSSGSIGGGYTNVQSWSASTSGSSEHSVQMGRICSPGYAI